MAVPSILMVGHGDRAIKGLKELVRMSMKHGGPTVECDEWGYPILPSEGNPILVEFKDKRRETQNTFSIKAFNHQFKAIKALKAQDAKVDAIIWVEMPDHAFMGAVQASATNLKIAKDAGVTRGVVYLHDRDEAVKSREKAERVKDNLKSELNKAGRSDGEDALAVFDDMPIRKEESYVELLRTLGAILRPK